MLVALLCGELMLCSLAPSGGGDWHYRTNVGPVAGKCWYIGPRMKPRSELYWAETPTMPPPMKVDDKWNMKERFETR